MTIPADEKDTPQPKAATGVFFLDWDRTMITPIETPQSLIIKIVAEEKTKRILKHALELGMHIHIVTARPNTEAARQFIFNDLQKLGLIDNVRNQDFWHKHIHCLTKDQQEREAFTKNAALYDAEVPKRKAECVHGLIRNHYSQLEKSFINFYDDEQANCDAVKKHCHTMTADESSANHIDHMESVTKKVNYSEKTKDLRRSLLQNLNGCLHAIYPQRYTWGADAKTAKAAGGVKEFHIALYADNIGLTLQTLDQLNQIAMRRLAKNGCACLPALFGGRKAPVQRIYEILADLKLDDGIIAAQATEKLEAANRKLGRLFQTLRPQPASIQMQPAQSRALS